MNGGRLPDVAPSVRSLVGTQVGALSLALLLIELIAGMQTYLTMTITPLIANDLNGEHLYGVMNAAVPVATFLTMPLGVPCSSDSLFVDCSWSSPP